MRGAEVSEPLVSIIIPCYNQGQFLAEAIESALGQSYPAREVLVIDDGSTDATAAVAACYAPHLRYLWQANGGVSTARNRGILEARGEFVLFLDADDYLAPDLLERHMAIAAVTPGGTVFHGAWQEVDLSGRVLRQEQACTFAGDVFHHLLVCNPFPIHAVTIHRSAFARVGLFDVRLRSTEDWDLWLRLAAAGHGFVAVPNAVAVYRRYPGSKSTDVERIWRTGRAVFSKSRAYHGGCRACRRATAAGMRNVRNSCCSLLVEDLVAHRARGETWLGVTQTLLIARRHPALANQLLREAVGYARRRAARLTSRLSARSGLDVRGDACR